MVCVLILVFMLLDFLKYQRKKARVREISQRRPKHESDRRPTSFFVSKIAIPCYTPFDNKTDLTPGEVPPLQPNWDKPTSAIDLVTVHTQNRIVLPPLPTNPVVDDGAVTRKPRKKKKLIPRKVLDFTIEDEINGDAQNDKPKKKSKITKKHKIDPLSYSLDDGMVHHNSACNLGNYEGGVASSLPIQMPSTSAEPASPAVDMLWQRHSLGMDNQSYESSAESPRKVNPPPHSLDAVQDNAVLSDDSGLRHQKSSPYYYTDHNKLATMT